MIVMKFGGTSVGNALRIKDVAQIAESTSKKERIVIVVSAVSGVTNYLVQAAQYASIRNQKGLNEQLEKIRAVHNEVLKGLELNKTETADIQQKIDNLLLHLESLLYSIYELAELSKRSEDLITSFGERMSIHLVAAAIKQKGLMAEPIEASELIITTDRFGNAQPLLDLTATKAKPHITKLLKKNVIPVITGFMGATEQGVVTTLGRGGSDYSAAILGNALDASEVWIWTDVDGVMTADPRIVKNARSIQELSYNEATELSYFGAKVLHPLTMMPAVLKKIPIYIKNTFNPSFVGTKIGERAVDTKHIIKAISTTKGISLITLQGKGMIGVPGVAAKLFGAIAAAQINVHFISQASSEFNISFVVSHEDSDRTVHIVKKAFQLELLNKYIETVKKEDHLAILAVVGQGMRGKPGIAGKIFSSLGTNKINIRAIAQGSSERNISCLIAENDIAQAVQVIHNAFELEQ